MSSKSISDCCPRCHFRIISKRTLCSSCGLLFATANEITAQSDPPAGKSESFDGAKQATNVQIPRISPKPAG